jgi:hypothetical protein
MPLTPTQILDQIECPCGQDIPNSNFKFYVLELLYLLANNVITPPAPTAHTLLTGTTSPVPAGAYTVTIKALTLSIIVNGITINANSSITLTANTNKVLPAIPITGTGTFEWGAII